MTDEFDPYISPTKRGSDFTEFGLEERITVFEERVKVWLLDVCENIYEKNIPYNGFAILKIIVSIFEMIGKHVKGYTGDRESFKHFDVGFRGIYSESYSKKASKLFYKYVRNPISHSGFVSPNVLITENIPHSFGYNENDLIKLNIKKLLEDLRTGFNQYVSDLQNPENKHLRENFEKRFIYEGRAFFEQFRDN